MFGCPSLIRVKVRYVIILLLLLRVAIEQVHCNDFC